MSGQDKNRKPVEKTQVADIDRSIYDIRNEGRDDYRFDEGLSAEIVERLSEEPAVALLETNVSCPNVKEGAIAFGQKADALYNITAELKKHAKQPIMMKLSPNVTDITEIDRKSVV